ncbi:DUF420 domain-containing protein [Nocardia sp. NPDC059180]|uniref:DUF420 domain-containing protein n=1 Tax=Nocardia sp. NPDC059180 TaxID=3346761 RepID=UPI0036803855
MSEFGGVDGFLGTRASVMMDVLIIVMAAVVAALAWSVYQVTYRRRYELHKRVQLPLGLALLAAIAVFEADIRINGWQDRAAGVLGGEVSVAVWTALAVHLVFAVTTVVLWPVVIVRAVRGFGSPPEPGRHSRAHVPWARLAAIDLVMTAVTGWVFYWVAFVQ